MATIIGGAGRDTLYGDATPSRLEGGDGDDALLAGPEASGGVGTDDLFDGGAGNDYVHAGYLGRDTLIGGEGDDSLRAWDTGYAREVVFDGGNGADWLDVSAGDGWVVRADAGAGNDHVELSSFGWSGTSDIAISLGDGNDLLQLEYVGGGAPARVSLGAGRDLVATQFSRATSQFLTVSDFGVGEAGDILDLYTLFDAEESVWDRASNPFAQGVLRLTQSGADVLVGLDLDADGTDVLTIVRLENVSVADLTAANFRGLDPAGLAPPRGETIVYPAPYPEDYHGTAGDDDLTTSDDIFSVGLLGRAGNDVLRDPLGGRGLSGGPGADTLIAGGARISTLYGDEGNDLFRIVGTVEGRAHGGDGNDTAEGGVAGDRLNGEAGADSLLGGGGADTLDGGGGADTLVGGAGADKLLVGFGADVVEGFEDGLDRLVVPGAETIASVVQSGADTVVTLSNGATVTLRLVSAHLVDEDDFEGAAFVTRIVGTDAPETLVGTAGRDRIEGGGARDIIQGLDLADTLLGGEGDDALLGYDGDDLLEGGAGADVLDPDRGSDTIDGGEGYDRLRFSFYDGGSLLDLALATGQLTGASGVKTITGVERFDGDMWKDTMLGSSGGDEFWGFLNDDLLIGRDGNDSLFGHGDHDTLVGDAGDDWLVGQSGNDSLSGGAGNDALEGAEGDDTLNGGAGADRFQLVGGGTDVVEDFDPASDTALFHLLGVRSSAVQVGADARIDIPGGGTVIFRNVDAKALTEANVSGLRLSELQTGTAGPDTLAGGDAADDLQGDGGADLLTGGAGRDVLEGGEGADWLQGGLDADTLRGGTGGEVRPAYEGGTVRGGGDLVDYGDATTVVYVRLEYGWGAQDSLVGIEDAAGGAFNDELHGSEAANLLYGRAGNDWLAGFGGDDLLIGESGQDAIEGGAGADTLIGGAGDDFLTGGAGADVFVFTPGGGRDQVTDFDDGDVLDLDAHAAAGLSYTVVQTAEGALFSFSDGSSLLLAGVTLTIDVQVDPAAPEGWM